MNRLLSNFSCVTLFAFTLFSCACGKMDSDDNVKSDETATALKIFTSGGSVNVDYCNAWILELK